MELHLLPFDLMRLSVFAPVRVPGPPDDVLGLAMSQDAEGDLTRGALKREQQIPAGSSSLAA